MMPASHSRQPATVEGPERGTRETRAMAGVKHHPENRNASTHIQKLNVRDANATPIHKDTNPCTQSSRLAPQPPPHPANPARASCRRTKNHTLNVFSNAEPVSMFLSLVRTNAAPFPGLTWRNSVTRHTDPSISTVTPGRSSLLDSIRTPCGAERCSTAACRGSRRAAAPAPPVRHAWLPARTVDTALGRLRRPHAG